MRGTAMYGTELGDGTEESMQMSETKVRSEER